MDPLTLFALANGAVSAVKAGCKLYKDIKGAAGDVKDVLKDLDAQFSKKYEGKIAPPEAKKQLQQEKARVVELNKADPGDVYTQIGEQLGVYFENMAKCITIFEEEERRSKELYQGDVSVGKRALQRVLMRKKLEQMEVDLRELLVYQSPPELGALYTDVHAMMEKINDEQRVAFRSQLEATRIAAIRRKNKLEALYINIAIGFGGLIVSAVVGLAFALVVQDRIQKYPQYGDGWIPKTERQRLKEAEPQIYIGR